MIGDLSRSGGTRPSVVRLGRSLALPMLLSFNRLQFNWMVGNKDGYWGGPDSISHPSDSKIRFRAVNSSRHAGQSASPL